MTWVNYECRQYKDNVKQKWVLRDLWRQKLTAVPNKTVTCNLVPYKAITCNLVPYKSVTCNLAPYKAVTCNLSPGSTYYFQYCWLIWSSPSRSAASSPVHSSERSPLQAPVSPCWACWPPSPFSRVSFRVYAPLSCPRSFQDTFWSSPLQISSSSGAFPQASIDSASQHSVWQPSADWLPMHCDSLQPPIAVFAVTVIRTYGCSLRATLPFATTPSASANSPAEVLWFHLLTERGCRWAFKESLSFTDLFLPVPSHGSTSAGFIGSCYCESAILLWVPSLLCWVPSFLWLVTRWLLLVAA